MTQISTETPITFPTGKVDRLEAILTRPLNVLHFQDSCGSGRTCRVILGSMEQSFSEITSLASVIIIHPEDAFDRDTPPESQIRRAELPKERMRELGFIDEEGYVRRRSLVLTKSAEVVAELPVDSDEDLATHVQNVLMPELRKLALSGTTRK